VVTPIKADLTPPNGDPPVPPSGGRPRLQVIK